MALICLIREGLSTYSAVQIPGAGSALITSILLSIYIPEPSPWQMFVFRGALAIGLASIAPIIPGFINLTSKISGRGAYFKIVAGGSIAIFVLIWLVNPPKM